jgi:hypothetical protein
MYVIHCTNPMGVTLITNPSVPDPSSVVYILLYPERSMFELASPMINT